MNRITPWITKIKRNEIFVFGSNLSGRHGAGAAKLALQWGAIYGQFEGLQGNTYAIPTVNASISNKLSIKEIKLYINNFIQFAKNNSNLIFYVTEIGCGLAGWSPNDIAPLFKEALNLNNIFLPESFWNILLEDKI